MRTEQMKPMVRYTLKRKNYFAPTSRLAQKNYTNSQEWIFRNGRIVKSRRPMEYEIKPQGRLNTGLRELWTAREMCYFFAWRDIKVRYKQTVLGVAWVVLQPLAMMAIFTLLLGRYISPGGR